MADMFKGLSWWEVALGAVFPVYFVANYSFAQMAQSMIAGVPSPNTSDLSGRTQTIRSPVAPHRIIYGEAVVGGTLVFTHSMLQDNARLYLVVVLAGHEVEEIGDVWLGETLHDDPKLGNRAQVTKYLGTADQTADPELVAVTNGLWTANHRLRGLPYLVVRLDYDTVAFPAGLPNIKCRIKGRKVYDPRTGTTGYSNNWALCVRDYLVSGFGLGCTADEIDDASFIAAANISDELVTLSADGATQKRYLCNGSFTLDQKPVDIMQKMLSAGVGRVVWQQGAYHLKAGAYSVPVGDPLTESDLRDAISIQTKPSKQNRFNGVKGTFSDPTKDWQPSDFPMVKNDLYIAEDTGEELFKDIELAFTTDSYAAQRIAKILLEKNRQGITVNFPAKFTAFDVAVGDTKYVSIARLGWVNKEFEVVGYELGKDGAGVDLVLQEEAASCYDWNYGEATTIDLAPDTMLPTPWRTDPPENVTVSEELYATGVGSVIKTRVTVSWASGPARRYIIQVNGADYGDMPGPATSYEFPDMAPGYRIFGVVAVNNFDVRSEAVTVPYTVIGKTAPPADVAGFAATLDPLRGVVLRWNANAEVDLDHYEITVPGTTGKTIVYGAEYGVGALPAGRWRWQIRAVDTSGNRSVNLASAMLTIEVPNIQTFLVSGRTLSWQEVQTGIALSGYIIRYQWGVNRSWADAIPMHHGILTSSPFTMPDGLSGPMTIMIAARDTMGNLCRDHASIVTDLGDLALANVIESIDFAALGWPTTGMDMWDAESGTSMWRVADGESMWRSTLTNGSVTGGALRASDLSGLMWGCAGAAMWNSPGAAQWPNSHYANMQYQFSTSFPPAAVGGRLSLDIAAQGNAISVMYRPQGPGRMWGEVTDDPMWADGGMWHVPDFTPWPGGIVAGPDSYDFLLSTGEGHVEGVVSGLTAIVDVEDITETFADIAISAAGTRLPITKTYRAIKSVNLTLQASGGTARTAEIIDKGLNGPLIKCFDAPHVATSGLVDAQVQGY